MKHSTLLLLLAFVSASVINSTEAAPFSRILASHQPATASQEPQLDTKQQSQPSPAGRIRLKSRSHPSSASSPSQPHHVRSTKIDKLLSEPVVAASWYHRTSTRSLRQLTAASNLQGHAIMDEEDDDAGNELLDTETEGLVRPDEDDTIEGEILEEEEDDEEDDGEDEDQEESQVQITLEKKIAAVEEKEGWLRENGLQDGDLVPEELEDEEDEVEAVVTAYGGRSAAADLAAGGI
ncbi:hypothetical protein BC939DRAFT_450843 [Gamsiella multidivaricata]|uniref:uncharacterized protein n=1 Tax=Gamsiella multidivaricata TaxID=101098 RepID=UPI00221E79E5|nr:uncharacterized protein BC939DRAFT_450843 [Gamsiella multidivaricata]KAG0367193.1 hypothetical protein BGZ54_004275 [Gamsiella multidivaricata]KAI7823796.1 hypothetical protein BC939DRAFT_450843 [Gamsiella multidivaricata]